MKKVMQQVPALLLGMLVFTIGCRKDDIFKPTPGPGHGGNGQVSNSFRVSIDSLPGETAVLNGLSAIVSITNENNQPVWTDKKISLQFNGKYISDSFTLDNGRYKITKLLLEKDNITKFAAPIVNSMKASSVQYPLPFSFELPKTTLSIHTMQVLRIASGDQAEHFGYPAGSFTTPGGNPPPVDPSPFVKIKVKASIKIGDIVYDSIPTVFTWITWDASGRMLATSTVGLRAGTNEVSLPNNAYKYNLQVAKWGITDEIELLKSDIHEGTVYILGGSKAAKKLKSELVYKWVNGAYQSLSKNEYQYDSYGRLTQILYYLRKADNTPYVSITDKFYYNAAGKAEKIKRYDENNALMGENNFVYDGQGRVNSVSQNESGVYTSGQVQYSASTLGSYDITIRYTSTTATNTVYTMNFSGGNKIQDAASTTSNSNESGKYVYDFNINPYAHMNWPDLYLSNLSRNNLKRQERHFAGAYPTAIPYGFEYTYDEDGYPKELVKTYFSYYGGVYMYTTKTVYNY